MLAHWGRTTLEQIQANRAHAVHAVDAHHGVNPPGRADLALGGVRCLDHSPTLADGPFLAQNQIGQVRMCTVSLNSKPGSDIAIIGRVGQGAGITPDLPRRAGRSGLKALASVATMGRNWHNGAVADAPADGCRRYSGQTRRSCLLLLSPADIFQAAAG